MMSDTAIHLPLIGENAPSFQADSTQGRINFPDDFRGKWGEEVIVPPPGSCGAAKERIESKDPSLRCVDWFLCFKKLDGPLQEDGNPKHVEEPAYSSR